MKKSAAIVGRAATASLAPYDDPEWDIFGLAWVEYPRATLLFDIHDPGFKAEAPFDRHYNSHKNPEYFETLEQWGVPVVCDPKAAGDGPLKFKNGIAFPHEEVAAILPRHYFDCTISYMVAYALLKGYERMGFWGCHFVTGEERRLQLPSVAWLIGLAEGRGVEVEIGPGQPMFMSAYEAGRYGVDQRKRWNGV